MTRKSISPVRSCLVAFVIILSSFKPAWSAISTPDPDTPVSPVITSSNVAIFLQASALLNQAAQILAEAGLAQAEENAVPLSLTDALTTQTKPVGTSQPEDFTKSLRYNPKKSMLPADADILDEPWQISSSNSGVILNEDGMVVPHMDDFGHDSHSSTVKRLGIAASASSTLQSFLHFLLPVQNALVTSPFGSRWGRPHQGIDMAAPVGSSIIAAEAGKIVYSGWKTGYGNFIVIDHGHGVETHYAHCSKVLTKFGRRVKKGELIGKVGNTGNSTGPHLHFEVVAHGVHRNPVKYLNRTMTVVEAH
jgi:murein DD-endopeptidase MepM/ murein hydrolase activator NlpD